MTGESLKRPGNILNQEIDETAQRKFMDAVRDIAHLLDPVDKGSLMAQAYDILGEDFDLDAAATSHPMDKDNILSGDFQMGRTQAAVWLQESKYFAKADQDGGEPVLRTSIGIFGVNTYKYSNLEDGLRQKIARSHTVDEWDGVLGCEFEKKILLKKPGDTEWQAPVGGEIQLQRERRAKDEEDDRMGLYAPFDHPIAKFWGWSKETVEAMEAYRRERSAFEEATGKFDRTFTNRHLLEVLHVLAQCNTSTKM